MPSQATPNKGKIVLYNGAQMPLEYQFNEPAPGGVCHGSFSGELSKIDPGAFAGQLKLVCADGRVLDVLVTHVTDRAANFIGAIIQSLSADNSDFPEQAAGG